MNPSIGLIGSLAPAAQSNDYYASMLNADQDDKGSTPFSAAQLTSQLTRLTATQENAALDNLISSALPNNQMTNGGSSAGSNVAASKVFSSTLDPSGAHLSRQQALQYLNNMLQTNSLSNLPSNSRSGLQSTVNSMDRQPVIDRLVERSPNANEIVQQLQLNVDIEKLYLSKAKLMLTLRRNETMITNLSDEERILLLKALDTSRLDQTIKRLTGLLASQPNGTLSGSITGLYASDLQPFQMNALTAHSSSSFASLLPASFGLQGSGLPAFSQPASGLPSTGQPANHQALANLQASSNQLQSNGTQTDLADELANRPLGAASTGSLIDQLQLLLAANKWIGANDSVDHYANLPGDDESSLLDDDLDTVNPIEGDL